MRKVISSGTGRRITEIAAAIGRTKMKKCSYDDRELALSNSNRRRFLGTAAIGGSVLLGSNLLSALNNGTKAAGKPIPVGGGVPLTGWAAADGIEFKRGLEIACEEINAVGGILGRPHEP